ncbi:MAG: lipopolysaccharide biosynthesis protein [Steroidobacteraceae bacterium]
MAEDDSQGLLRRYRAIISEGSWVVAGQGMTGIFTLAGTRLITQTISPELYGAVNLVQNALMLLRTLFCAPMLNAGLRYYPDAERGGYVPELRRLLWRKLGRAIIAMEILGIFGGLVWSIRAGIHPSILFVLAAFIALDVIRTLETSLFNSARMQRPAAIFSVVETVARPLLVVAGALLIGRTVEVVLGAVAASIFVTLVLLYATVSSGTANNEVALPPTIAKEMRRYAIPLIPIALLNWTSSVSDRYIIEWISHDISSVGIYAAAYGLISQPFLLLHGVVALTLRPVYFSAVSRDEHDRAEHTFRVWLAITASICVTATILIYLAHNVVVEVLLGPKYRSAAVFVPWIGLGYLFYVCEQVLEQKLLAYKRTSAVLAAQTCGGVSSIAVTIPFVMHFGAVGAAFACPIYFLIQTCVVAILIYGRPSNEHPASRARAATRG